MTGIEEAIDIWSLSDVGQIADTPGSRVYRGRGSDRRSVVIKVLKPAGLGEMPGMDYLGWRGGHGAIRLLARHDNVCLLEDAGTWTLEALRQAEGETAAAAVFASILHRLRSPSPAPPPGDLVALERHFAGLLRDRPRMPQAHRANVEWAAGIARDLLAQQTDVMPLHGDLHHENIHCDDLGQWRAIDPHGLIGDPVYDTANFFGNPLGRPDITCDVDRIDLLADSIATALGYDRTKLLHYAAAHSALSACWSIADPVSDRDIEDAAHRLELLDVVRSILAT